MKQLLLSLLCLMLIFHTQGCDCSSSNSTSGEPQCHPDERSALLQLLSSFSANPSAPGTQTTSWNKSTNCCTWSGISCDQATGHVISLDLSYSGLRGSINSNSSLFLLRHLQTLDLSTVDFRGSSIPPEFGKFKNMARLQFAGNNFSGVVPLEISHLSKLVSFKLLAYSQHRVAIGEATFKALARNMTDLRELVFDSVNMSGVPLLSFTNLSSSLTSLGLRYCLLSGRFHDNAFDHLWKLQALDLSENFLSGHIPRSSLHSRSVSRVDLSFNNFTGEIPDAYNNSTQNISSRGGSSKYPAGVIPSRIIFLDLLNNSLVGNIPHWVFELPHLVQLTLNNNLLTGPIYDFRTTSLVYLILSNNKFHGLIPRSIFQNVELSALDLSSNNFTGNFELEQLSELKDLSYLSLSFNNFVALSFNKSIKYDFGYLHTLGLSHCNIREFPHFLRQAKSLVSVDLSHNQIQGSVPKWFVDLGKNSVEYLNLSHNLLTHIKPLPWINIYILDLSSNLFSVPLPISSSMGRLEIALLSKNQFSGEMPISFCKLFLLVVLDLSYNKLSGKVPHCITTTSTSLSVLDLRMNDLRGTIPMTFAKENSLRTLNYNGNHLEGTLDRSLLNCKKLEVLDIGGNNISGPFPQWLETLPELQVLILRANKFYGPIGNPINAGFSFQKLRIMDLSDNAFTGLLPERYFENLPAMMDAHTNDLEHIGEGYYRDSVTVTIKGYYYQLEKILTIFTTIDLSRNSFEGEIPWSIGKLKSLKGLNFSHNKFVGHVPLSLGNLSNLEWLDLSSNGLSGVVPNELAEDLTQLSFLNVSLNRLVGPIPRGKQFNTFENDSYIGNLGLCGSPLSRTCTDGQAQQLSPTSSKHEDEVFDWKIVMLMGYGCGMVFGLSMGYVMIPNTIVDRILEIVRGLNSRKQRRPQNNVRRVGGRN